MITKTEKKAIVSTLGKQYTSKVIAQLDSRKIFNSKGESFSPPSVRLIVNGTSENLQVEREIVKLVAKVKKAKAKDKSAKKKILK